MAFDTYLKKRLTDAGVTDAVAPVQPARIAPETPVTTTPAAPAPIATPTVTPAPVATTAPAAPPASNPTTDITKTYIDRLTDTLAGKDATVQNARNTAGTQNAVGDYIAKRSGRQESVNAGYTPGTLQSQRTMDRFQEGANETALARDNQVNEMQRGRSDEALNAANQLRTEGRQDIETLINSIQDPVTKAYVRRVQAAGGDVRGAIAGNLGNQGGTGGNQVTLGATTDAAGNPLDPNTGLPISKTPAQLALESATNEIKTFYPDLDPNSDEFKSLVRDRTSGATEAELRSITEANKASKVKDAMTSARSNFESLTPEQSQLLLDNTTAFNPVEVPVGAGAFKAFKETNPIVKIGGKLYKPVDTLEWRQGKNRDFSVFQAPDGSYLYVDRNGRTTTQPAPTGAAATHQGRGAWIETFT